MASSQSSENLMQCKTCLCGEGDANFWISRSLENSDKQTNKCPNCKVFKSGPLLISSKGLGWTSWKKRWFVLTRTSLVFFRADPSVLPQKGNEANSSLGGIDLNNSGSVDVKADRKILMVIFPDGRDGRTFTLKAETSEDLYEWKVALENALAQAPSATTALVQNGIFRSDVTESSEVSHEKERDRQSTNSSVIGKPASLALEDIDGSPSFLEKALKFIEQHGIKVEGILRQSADVEEVKRRVQEYEQGKIEFSPDEDAHVIGDCIKYILREMPSSPVPASCCTALVKAYRTDRGNRVDCIRAAIFETFPEPNCHLLQRILKMMQMVESYKSQNRMSLSALAACMAPLLLRPLLLGECEFEDDFNMGGDGSIQLMQAAAAANHAQAIVVIMLEDYETIFNENLLHEDSMSSDLYSDSEDGDVEDDYSTDNDNPEDDEYHNGHNDSDNLTDTDISEDDGFHDEDNSSGTNINDDSDHSSSGTVSESHKNIESNVQNNQKKEDACVQDRDANDAFKCFDITAHDPLIHEFCHQKSSATDKPEPKDSTAGHNIPTDFQKHESIPRDVSNTTTSHGSAHHESAHNPASSFLKSVSNILPSSNRKVIDKPKRKISSKQPTIWGRASQKKNLPMKSKDLPSENESAIQKLKQTKDDLQIKFANDVKENVALQEGLKQRKEALHERRLTLEQDIERLREQLQNEKDLRTSLESGLLNMGPNHISVASALDSKTRADLEEVALVEADIAKLKQKVADLRGQLDDQLTQSYDSLCESCGKNLCTSDNSTQKRQLEEVRSTCPDQHSIILIKDGEIMYKFLKSEQELLSSEAVLSLEQYSESDNQNVILPGSFSPKDSISRSSKNKGGALSLPSQSGEPHSEHHSTESRALNCTLNSEESSMATSKNYTYKKGTPMVNENAATQTQESASLADGQPSQMQRTKRNGGKLSKGNNKISSAEEGSTKVGQNISKKFMIWGDFGKKEAQDPQLTNKQSVHKKQSSDPTLHCLKSQTSTGISSSEMPAVAGHTGDAKGFSFKLEETISSSSSALVKLTNRLNFLKERRAQLANEQTKQNTRRSAQDSSQRTSAR
ncbi:rho GTPase-activating protein 6-like isoform X1 [Zingiber officinale]|uniref:rho GTPase-activating protein 6-like isoform X1 n=1 Tax=Zingiber officinale TaxID=94328 RepID=UPI001C4D5D78|nr:rho GTPase-activating protein 6-like isoform X1 [Zingiber officinale]XP_042441820.1 rho GTPase-activating protein 6-like isoform X1 [Zingiber officinale]XP_042441821.1 rho GTPase-activating protein 6-like isoform X1 [Zingiber officinale]